MLTLLVRPPDPQEVSDASHNQSMDLLLADAILEFGDDLREASAAADEWARINSGGEPGRST
jgi:hypothetical protein